jgi:hypothetical protein
MLKYLGVSRSGYNAWKKHIPSDTEKRREAVKQKIMHIYNESHQNYGAPKITKELHKDGEIIAERTVGKYMKQLGIKAQWVKPWTITTKDSDFSNELQNILDEQFNPDRPNAVWCTDRYRQTAWICNGAGFLHRILYCTACHRGISERMFQVGRSLRRESHFQSRNHARKDTTVSRKS